MHKQISIEEIIKKVPIKQNGKHFLKMRKK